MHACFRSLISLAVAGWLGGSVLPAVAQQVIYSTGFENPPFAAGSHLVGQDGWNAPGFLSPDAAILSTTAAHTGAQGVMVRGTDMVGNDIVNPPFGAVGSYRLPVNYAANGATTIVSSDVFIGGPQSAPGLTAPFFGATVAARLGGVNGADTYEFQLSSEGAFYGFDDNLLSGPTAGDPGVLPHVSGELGHWYNMALESDFTARTVTFLLDGQVLGSIPFSDPTFDTLQRGSLVVYASPDDTTFSRNDYAAHFDNFAVVATPEPGSLALGAAGLLGGLSLLRRRRMRSAVKD